jgi:hypothetical protein
VDYLFSSYFETVVRVKRPYVTREICVHVLQNPLKSARQSDGRVRYWSILPEFGGRALRVVVLADGRTIHNAFLDRGYKP